MLKGISVESYLVRRKDHPDARAFSPLASPPTTKENEPAEDDIPLLANVVYRP